MAYSARFHLDANFSAAGFGYVAFYDFEIATRFADLDSFHASHSICLLAELLDADE
jgi:hypothetical protein